MNSISGDYRLTPSIRSVDRALSTLEMIAEAHRGLSLGELRRRLRLPKSSSHCLIITLERRGYIVRNPANNRYVPSTKLLNLGEATLNGMTLREKAGPFLQNLMRETGLTVHLAILDDGCAVIIDKIAIPGSLRLATWIGRRFDLHCSGVGKAMLAYLPQEKFLSIARGRGLMRYNENTITSITRLSSEIASIQRQGYAFEDEEGEIGFRCIGAPILDDSKTVTAAVSVSGTINQITEANVLRFAKEVSNTARQISLLVAQAPRAF